MPRVAPTFFLKRDGGTKKRHRKCNVLAVDYEKSTKTYFRPHTFRPSDIVVIHVCECECVFFDGFLKPSSDHLN
jgi:hypothetical protein